MKPATAVSRASNRSSTRTASSKSVESVGGWIAAGTTVASMRTVRAGSIARAAALVTSRSFIVARVAGWTRSMAAASAERDGGFVSAPIRQNARYVDESAT